MENAVVRVPVARRDGRRAARSTARRRSRRTASSSSGRPTCAASGSAAGFCAHGLAGAGGMGKLVAEWIVDGTPSLDVWHMDSRRFGAAYRSRELHARAHEEVYETYYDVRYPGHERQAGRPSASRRPTPARASSARRSARSRAGSARTGSSRTPPRATSRSGRAAGPGSSGRPRSEPSTRLSRGRGDLRRVVVREDRRDRGGRRRRSSRGSREPRRARRRAGHLHAVLNAARRIECDFTVTRLREDRFRIVTGTAFGQHDLAWLRQHAAGGRLGRRSSTSRPRYACLGVSGPSARTILQPLTTTSLANEAFPYMTRAGALGRPGPVPRRAGDVRRRARLGALLPGRVRPRLWDDDVGSGA